MIEILCSKSSITADTGFRKFYPAGGTNSNTRMINLEKNQMKTQRGIMTEQLQDSYKFQGATPPSYPRRSWPAPKRTQRFASMVVNDWEPESVTGLVDTAKTLRLPKQYRCILAQS